MTRMAKHALACLKPVWMVTLLLTAVVYLAAPLGAREHPGHGSKVVLGALRR